MDDQSSVLIQNFDSRSNNMEKYNSHHLYDPVKTNKRKIR